MSCQSNSDAQSNSGQMVAGTTGESQRAKTSADDYVVFDRVRMLDNVGFDRPVEAYSILLPTGWKTTGEVIWVGPQQPCSGNNSWLKSASPDGRYQFEVHPTVTWSYSTNQQLLAMQQQGQSDNCYIGEPMNAGQYFEKVFVPRVLNNAQIVSIANNPEASNMFKEEIAKYTKELMSYGASDVRYHPHGIIGQVRFNDNSEGVVMIVMNNSEITIPNMYNGTYDKNYTSVATHRIVLKHPAGKGEQAKKMLSVIMTSYRTNPAWKDAVDQYWYAVRQNRQQISIGKIKAMDDQTRRIGDQAIANGNQRLADMDNQMRSWEGSQRSQDRQHSQFIKAIREVEHYQDQTGKVELSAGYNHAWSRSDGSSYILTDNPNFNPSSVFQDQRWEEMKKID